MVDKASLVRAIKRTIVKLGLHERRVMSMFLQKLPTDAPPKPKPKRRRSARKR